MTNSPAQLFTRFAERECKDNAPLYYQLSKEIAKDKELLALAAHAKARQPVPNLFLAAVHYLLIANPSEKLALYYPTLHEKRSQAIPFSLFKSFCSSHQETIRQIIQTRIVQTNAINRTAYLMPIIAQYAGTQAIDLVDIGTSSGLALNMDLYQYHYQMQMPCSIGNSRVKIVSEIKGKHFPTPQHLPIIRNKIGIDQNPIDLQNSDAADWLKALIWADHVPRFIRMQNAIEVAKQHSIQLIKADRIDQFRKVLEAIPKENPLVIYHTHVLYQFSPQERLEFRRMVDQIGNQRDLLYLAVEANSIFDGKFSEPGVLIIQTEYKDGKKEEKLIATTKGHAQWIQFFP